VSRDRVGGWRAVPPSLVAAAGASVVVALFVILKLSAGFPFVFDDEHNYFAMGQLLASGEVPYRDFILEHPPLEVLLIGLCDAAFGSHYLLYKGLLLLFSVILGALLFLTVEGEHGPLAAFFSCALLFSADTYFIESTFMRGHNSGLVLVALASLLSRRQTHQWLAGVVFGLAFLTGLYAIIPFATFLAYQWLIEEQGKVLGRNVLEMLGGFCLTALSGQLLILLVAGRGYIDQVFLYQLYRSSGWDWTTQVIRETVLANAPVFVCGLLGLVLLRKKDIWHERLFLLGFVPGILSISKIFRMYFLMPIYFLAIPGGALLARICHGAKRFKPLAIVGLAAAMTVPATLSFRHYRLYNQKWEVPGVQELTETIRAGTEKDDLIFGGLVVPLFAFLTGRRVFGNALYTDIEMFDSGLLDLDVIRGALASNPRVKFVVMTDHGGYLSARGGRLNAVLSRYFRGVGGYRGAGDTVYLLRRVAVAPPGHAPTP